MKYVLILLSLLCCAQTNAMELKATVNDVPVSDLDIQNWKQLLLFQQRLKQLKSMHSLIMITLVQ